MNKKFGMSGMGFAITIVIIIGLVMIISAPSFVDNSSKNENISQTDDLKIKLQDFENQVNERLNNIETNSSNQSGNNYSQSISNKYICTIEGNLDENGNVVKVDSHNGLTKFVFVCEYRP